MKFQIVFYIVGLVAYDVVGERNFLQEIQNAITVAQFEVEILVATAFITPDADKIIQIDCYNPTSKTFSAITTLLDPDIPQKLDLTKRVGFLIHGWMDSYDDDFILDTFAVWTQNRDENVCRVDWSYYSEVDYYTASRTNIFIVANYLTEFLSGLNRLHNVQYKDIILVGHSLGAHICGLIGSGSNEAIGIIIGLDPAGPLFTVPYVIPKKFRLDADDATIVQAIHTGDGTLGATLNIGKQDFRLNTGFGIQRGCYYPNLVNAYHNDAIRCSHFRSYQIFQSALIDPSKCRAIRCSNLLNYLGKRCASVFDTLGLTTNGIPGVFYIATWDNPECINQYYL